MDRYDPNDQWTLEDYLDEDGVIPVAFNPFPEFGEDGGPQDQRDYTVRSANNGDCPMIISDYDTL
jgi:hypothetical protein